MVQLFVNARMFWNLGSTNTSWVSEYKSIHAATFKNIHKFTKSYDF